MQTVVTVFVSLVALVQLVFIVLAFGRVSGPSYGQLELGVSFADLITVILTALTIILGFVGLGIAVLAFRTKEEIMKDARRTATEVAGTQAQEVLVNLQEQATDAVNIAIDEQLPKLLEDKLTEYLTQPEYSDRLDQALAKAFNRQAYGQDEPDEDDDA